jgi:hypothetical protein
MQSRRYSIHGYISVALFFAALLFGFYAVLIFSPVVAAIYLLLSFAAFSIVAAFYCSKCKCRKNCNHWIIGKLSVLLSKPKEGDYTKSDLFLKTLFPLAIMIAFPQFWLIKSFSLFIIYWALSFVAGIEIYAFVCNKCLNAKCSMCRNKFSKL